MTTLVGSGRNVPGSMLLRPLDPSGIRTHFPWRREARDTVVNVPRGLRRTARRRWNRSPARSSGENTCSISEVWARAEVPDPRGDLGSRAGGSCSWPDVTRMRRLVT